MNKVILSGRLTKEPQLRYSQAAEPCAVCEISIAVDRYVKGEEKKADFFNCVSFGARAEAINNYFNKGNKILIEGELRNDSYTDKEGHKRQITKVLISNFEFCEKKSTKAETKESTSGVNDFYCNAGSDHEEDLPF